MSFLIHCIRGKVTHRNTWMDLYKKCAKRNFLSCLIKRLKIKYCRYIYIYIYIYIYTHVRNRH